jgi:hypothetical protein
LRTYVEAEIYSVGNSKLVGENTTRDLITYLQSNNIEIPVLIIGSDSEITDEYLEKANATHLATCVKPKDVVKSAAQILGVTAKMMA